MPKKYLEFKERMIQKGDFNLKSLNNIVRNWFESNDYEYTEKDSTTKMKKQGVEVQLKHNGYRLIDDFAKSEVKVIFFLINAKRVISKDKKLVNGDLEIRITAELIVDYKHKFVTKFKSFLLNIYIKYLIKDRFEKIYETQTYSDGAEICSLLKEDIGLAVYKR